jgi:hypothetical protein
MKDSENYNERCENCKVYPCISLTNLDKLYGSEVYVWAKRITAKVGCKVFPR